MKPFDAEATCPKCGGADVSALYCPAQRPWNSLHKDTFPEHEYTREHIHRLCQRCRYQWLEAPIRRKRRVAVPAEAIMKGDRMDRPAIVCLCGSTRFWRTFQLASLQETLAGRIVLSIGAASGTDDEHFGNLAPDEYAAVKQRLDELHLCKIDLADEVLILDVDGYIGESTARELAYARLQGTRVRFWTEEVEHGANG